MRCSGVWWVVLATVGCSRELTEVRAVDSGPSPRIDSFAPAAALAGQTAVRVDGEYFPEDAEVFFGALKGMWAIGEQYEHSDTVLWAIPPLGTSQEVEISVRGSSGEARAGTQLLVFETPPDITRLSSDTITRSDELVVFGRGFNPVDPEARLVVAGQEVFDLDVNREEITARLHSIGSFAAMGSGWKILRYRYTPYEQVEPGVLAEAAHPVCVVQEPAIWVAQGTATSGGLVVLGVNGYDRCAGMGTAGFARNAISVGGVAVAVHRAEINPSSANVVWVLVTLPDLGEGQHPLTLSTVAGTVSSEISVAANRASSPPAVTEWHNVAVTPGERGVFQSSSGPEVQHVITVPGFSNATGSFDLLAIARPSNSDGYGTPGRYQLWLPEDLGSSTWASHNQLQVQRAGTVHGSDSGERVIAALITNDADETSPTTWELLLLRGQTTCSVPLAGASQPSYRSNGELRPVLLQPDRDDDATLGIWLRGHMDEDGSGLRDPDQVFVVDFPNGDLALACPSLRLQLLPATGNWEHAALTRGDDGTGNIATYVALATGQDLEVWKVRDGAAPDSTPFATLNGMSNCIGVERRWQGALSAFDPNNTTIHNLYVSGGYSTSTVTVESTSLGEPFVTSFAQDRWWLGGNGGRIESYSVNDGSRDNLWFPGASVNHLVAEMHQPVRFGVLSAWTSPPSIRVAGIVTLPDRIDSDFEVVVANVEEPLAAWPDQDRYAQIVTRERMVTVDSTQRSYRTSPFSVMAQQVELIDSNGVSLTVVRSIENRVNDPDADPPSYVGTVLVAERDWQAPYALRNHGRALVRSAAESDGLPLRVQGYPRDWNGCNEQQPFDGARMIVAQYNVDATAGEQTVELWRHDVPRPDGGQSAAACMIGSATTTLPTGFNWQEVVNGRGIALQSWILEPPWDGTGADGTVGCGGSPRLLLALTGQYWRDLLFFDLDTSGDGTSCPTPVTGSPALAVTSSLPNGPRAAATRINGQSARLLVLAQRNDADTHHRGIGVVDLSEWPDPGQTHPVSWLSTFHDCQDATALAATPWGALLKSGSSVCGALLPNTITETSSAERLFASNIPDGSGWSRLIVSADGSQLWVGGGWQEQAAERLHRMDAATGQITGTLELDGRVFFDAFWSATRGHLMALTMPYEAMWWQANQLLARGGVSLAEVE